MAQHLNEFLKQHGESLQIQLGEHAHERAIGLFFNPKVSLPPTPSIPSEELPEVLARALELAMGRVMAIEGLGTRQRLGLFDALGARAAAVTIAEGISPSARLQDDVIELLNIVMHDIRSPLVTIRGYIEMMLRGSLGPMTPQQEKSMRVAMRNSLMLDDQIDTLLDFARLKQGRVALMSRAISAEKLASKALEGFEEVAERKGLALRIELPSPELEVAVDQDKCRRILRILLDNAIKFTDQGEVVLRIEPAEGLGSARLSVRDTGAGVPEAFRESIFEPFIKVPGPNHTRGAGLGLAVARALARSHQGDLTLEDHQPQGCRFWFEVPLARPARR